MSELRSSLARHLPETAMTEAEFEHWRARLWREKRGVLLWLDEIADEFVRQGVANLAKAKFEKGAR